MNEFLNFIGSRNACAAAGLAVETDAGNKMSMEERHYDEGAGDGSAMRHGREGGTEPDHLLLVLQAPTPPSPKPSTWNPKASESEL